MTKIISTRNFTDEEIRISLEPLGSLFILAPNSLLSIESIKYDLGDRLVLYYAKDGIVVDITNDEDDFYDTIVVRIDGKEREW